MKRKTDCFVELLRIVACLMVIGLHLTLNPIIDNHISLYRQFVNLLFADGATIFWLITGFFIVKSDYKNSIKKALIKLWIPTIILSVSSYLIYDYTKLLSGNLNDISVGNYILNILKGIISFRNFAPSSSHFWFIYIYCLVVLISPLIKKIINLLEDRNLYRWFIVITFVLLCINDLFINNIFHFGTHHLAGLIPATIIIIYGHFVYKYRDNIFNNRFNKIYLILFIYILLNIFRTILMVNDYQLGFVSSLDYWFSSISVINCILVAMFVSKVYDISFKKYDDHIYRISKYTLYIYMIHPYLIKVIKKLSLYKLFITNLSGNNVVLEYLHILILCVLVFMICLVVCMIIDRIIGVFRKKRYE